MPSQLVNVFIRFMADPKNIGRLCDLVGEMPNIEFPTMGGLVFWDTLATEHGYKLQKNKITGHCRTPRIRNTRLVWESTASLAKQHETIAGV